MWGPLRIGVALLALGASNDVLPTTSTNSGMTLVVRLPDGKKTKLPITGTPAAPQIKGSAEIEYRGGRSSIKLTLDKLPDPRRVSAFATTYVAWVVRADQEVESLAEVPVKKQGVTGTTGARTLGVIVTAEPYGPVRVPSSLVVAELTLPQASDARLQSTTVTYERVSEDLYRSGLTDGSAPTP